MNSIKQWFVDLARVWKREFRLVFTDPGVLVFFFVLPLLYPVVYALIYNPELARDVPVAVVDNSRTAMSRELVRMADATEQMQIIGYATDLEEARRWQNEKACYGIMVIPEDYARRIGRGEQAVVPFYSDMSLLLRYRGFLTALTDLQLATGAQVRADIVNSRLGLLGQGMAGQPVNSSAHFMGDPEQGFCSFIIPGIIVLILQQSLVLG
ncbi:MAG: ABC transporter permease, partial [Muribaculaceae bacterium]|nr:ABC transporter permease [Muribaculaceae bacterium]